MNLDYTVSIEDSGKNVKYILKNRLELSERLIKKLKMNGKVFCNGIPVYVNAIVKPLDSVLVSIDFDEPCDHILSEDIKLDILFEDDSLIVINKNPFIVVHPTFNHPSGTIANGIIHYYKEKGLLRKIRPVSRLDRDTSGIIIFAKNEYVQEALIRQMHDNTFKKEYFGIVHGLVEKASGTINLPIDRKPDSIMLRHICESGSAAVTHFEVVRFLNQATFLKFILETGRTHQIRVHCQAIQHPLIGDTLYPYLSENFDSNLLNPLQTLINRQALHSYRVNFLHPLTKEPMELIAPMPQDMELLINSLEIVGK